MGRRNSITISEARIRRRDSTRPYPVVDQMVGSILADKLETGAITEEEYDHMLKIMSECDQVNQPEPEIASISSTFCRRKRTSMRKPRKPTVTVVQGCRHWHVDNLV